MILSIISWKKTDKLLKIKFIKDNFAKKPWFKVKKKRMIKFKKSSFYFKQKSKRKI